LLLILKRIWAGNWIQIEGCKIANRDSGCWQDGSPDNKDLGCKELEAGYGIQVKERQGCEVRKKERVLLTGRKN